VATLTAYDVEIRNLPRNVKRAVTNDPLLLLNPDEWHERLDLLTDPARHHVALIVWWDYLARRFVKHRDPSFDAYLKQTLVPCGRELILEGLIAVGYQPFQADGRLPYPEQKTTYQDYYHW
jgi:hypothetical protein